MVKEPPKAPWRPFARGSRGLSRQMGHRVQEREQAVQSGGSGQPVESSRLCLRAGSLSVDGEWGWRVPTKLLR